ncbi:MAG TPA: hypothetical protein VGT03_06075 [Candidatus Acidoferrales bacterium]|nr:hypothetical protein [Candidatus Acidoferrales bacterium]
MFAALIFVMSLAMAAQFAIYFWRSAFLATAALPISERIQMAQESISNALNQNDFGAISSLTEICPDLGSPAGKFASVRAYYQLLRGLASFSKAILPSASMWAQNEMAACTRFVAVSMDLRLKSNEALLAELRSY